MNIARKPVKLAGPAGPSTDMSTPSTARLKAANTSRVKRAPPTLSEIQPPSGRVSDPTSGPRKADVIGSMSGNNALVSIAKPAENPMNDPKVPTYSQNISQLCLRVKIAAWSANEALASAMSFMPNHAASDE